ncbi:MAG TPA: hypothetical protein VLL25_06445 [Acidimicrobiales bacterium]|nr:hypothetical protein [Acidimicrobiales bacterium]
MGWREVSTLVAPAEIQGRPAAVGDLALRDQLGTIGADQQSSDGLAVKEGHLKLLSAADHMVLLAPGYP